MKFEEELIEWKKKVVKLHLAEDKLCEGYKNGQLTENERKKLKKIINNSWINIWSFHPDNNPSVEKAFKLHFS